MLAVYRYMRGHRRAFFTILLTLILVGTLPVVIFGSLAYRYFRDYVESQVVSAQLDRLFQTESYISAVLDEAAAGSHELLLNMRFLNVGSIGRETIGRAETALETVEIQDLLTNLKSSSRFIESAYYYNPDRDFLITTDGSVVRDKYHDTEWVAAGLPAPEDGPVWLPTRSNLDKAIQINPLLARFYESNGLRSVPVLSFVRPVSPFVASFGGYITININVATLARELAVVSREPDGEFFILDDSGRIMLSTGTTPVGETFGLHVDTADADKLEGVTVVNTDSQSMVVYYRVSDNSWVYAFARDAGALMALYREIGQVTILLALAITAVATAAAILFSRVLYSPIDSIVSELDARAQQIPERTNELAYIHDVLKDSLEESTELRAFYQRSTQAVKENTLRKLVAGQVTDTAAVLPALRAENRKLSRRWFGMAVAVTDPGDRDQLGAEDDLRLAQHALIRYCEALRAGSTEMLGVTTDVRRVVLLINTDDQQAVRDTLDRVAGEAPRALGVRATIVVGRFYTSVLDATTSYDDAVAVLDGRVLEHDQRVVFRDDVELCDQSMPSYPFEIEERLIYHLKAGDGEGARSEFDRFLSRVFQSPQTNRDRVEAVCMALISSILRSATLAGANTIERLDDANPYRAFLEQDHSVDTIRSWFVRFFEETTERLFSRDDRSTTHKRLIEKCIEESFSEDISLEQVAVRTGISYSYIRKIFTPLFGMHFNSYLNGIRIDKARHYLRATDESITQIARRVGYLNDQRFYRNFRRVAGCTPTEYRSAASVPDRSDVFY